MGLFDTINVFMKCPYCSQYRLFDAQTYDLGKRMFSYSALSPKWESEKFGKRFRETLRVFPRFPKDKSNKLWNSQSEEIEAESEIPAEFKKLRYIKIIAGCNSIECQFYADRKDIFDQGLTSGFGRLFEGKIRIKKGRLRGAIYDIKKNEFKEKYISCYKEKYKKIFNRLIKTYKHEPIVCRNWNSEVRNVKNAKR